MTRLAAVCTTLALAFAAGCGSDDASGDRADAAPRSDAGATADAAPRPDAPTSEADAAVGPNAVIHQSGDSLRIAVAEKFQPDNPCYPEPDVEAVVILLPVTEAEAGQTVAFSPDTGGSAHVCPPEDSGESCQNLASGSVSFDRYDPEDGAVGSYDLDGGSYTGAFGAVWCE